MLSLERELEIREDIASRVQRHKETAYLQEDAEHRAELEQRAEAKSNAHSAVLLANQLSEALASFDTSSLPSLTLGTGENEDYENITSESMVAVAENEKWLKAIELAKWLSSPEGQEVVAETKRERGVRKQKAYDRTQAGSRNKKAREKRATQAKALASQRANASQSILDY